MDPTVNDVLSGRGAWFNRHPGNEHFRRMLEEKKDVYMAGTKKQKMDMSKAIVEAIYSMDPPGRFLKKCPESGRWNELSKRDAADRAAQAMAYVVKGKDTSKRKKEERRRSRRISLQKSKDNDDDVSRKSSHNVDRPAHLQPHETTNQLDPNHSTSRSNHELAARRGGAVGTWNNTQCSRWHLVLQYFTSLQAEQSFNLILSPAVTPQDAHIIVSLSLSASALVLLWEECKNSWK